MEILVKKKINIYLEAQHKFLSIFFNLKLNTTIYKQFSFNCDSKDVKFFYFKIMLWL
jgi:hypothetical protein